MIHEEFQSELAGLIGRLSTKVLKDPRVTRAMAYGDGAEELVLDGLEEAIIGLVLLHINIRRGLS